MAVNSRLIFFQKCHHLHLLDGEVDEEVEEAGAEEEEAGPEEEDDLLGAQTVETLREEAATETIQISVESLH